MNENIVKICLFCRKPIIKQSRDKLKLHDSCYEIYKTISFLPITMINPPDHIKHAKVNKIDQKIPKNQINGDYILDEWINGDLDIKINLKIVNKDFHYTPNLSILVPNKTTGEIQLQNITLDIKSLRALKKGIGKAIELLEEKKIKIHE